MKVPWAKKGYPQTIEKMCTNCGNTFIAPKGTGANWCKKCWMYFGYQNVVVSEEQWQAFLQEQNAA